MCYNQQLSDTCVWVMISQLKWITQIATSFWFTTANSRSPVDLLEAEFYTWKTFPLCGDEGKQYMKKSPQTANRSFKSYFTLCGGVFSIWFFVVVFLGVILAGFFFCLFAFNVNKLHFLTFQEEFRYNSKELTRRTFKLSNW